MAVKVTHMKYTWQNSFPCWVQILCDKKIVTVLEWGISMHAVHELEMGGILSNEMLWFIF